MIELVSAVPIIIAAYIQRSQRDARKRWISLTMTVGVAAVLFSMLCSAAVVQRGYSKSSAAVLALGMVTLGAACWIIAPRVEVANVAWRGKRAILFGEPTLRYRSFPRLVLIWVWLILASLLVLIPLRYMGALTQNQFGGNVAKIVSLGYFAPLERLAPLTVGLCYRAHGPEQAENLAVPCDSPHRSEVVDAGSALRTTCPDAADYADTGLQVEVVGIVRSHVQYCVVRSTNVEREWSGTLSKSLPKTL